MSWSVHQIIDHELWTDNIGHTTTFHSPNTTSLGATYRSCQLCASLNRKHIVHKMRIRVLYIQILRHVPFQSVSTCFTSYYRHQWVPPLRTMEGHPSAPVAPPDLTQDRPGLLVAPAAADRPPAVVLP